MLSVVLVPSPTLAQNNCAVYDSSICYHLQQCCGSGLPVIPGDDLLTPVNTSIRRCSSHGSLLQHCRFFTARTRGNVLQVLSASVPQCCTLQLHCTVLHGLITPKIAANIMCVCVSPYITLSFCDTQTSSFSDHGSLQFSLLSEGPSLCLCC